MQYARRQWQWRLAGAVLVLGVVVGNLLVGTTASARAAPRHSAAAGAVTLVPNLTLVSQPSASNSANKSVTATCPTGLRVYGAGGQITGGVGNVVLDAVIPNAALTAVTARGTENGSYATNWTVTAYAICGSATANLQRVSFTGPANSSPKSEQVNCPVGTNVFGLGFSINGGNGLIFPDRWVPSASLTNVVVRATRDADSTSVFNWSITTYAICANPASGMERISEGSLSNSTSPKSVSPGCSAGKRLHGLGGETTAAGNAILDDLTPNSALTGSTVTVYENPPNFAGNWSAIGYAICAF
jgi:hypothetical protein